LPDPRWIVFDTPVAVARAAADRICAAAEAAIAARGAFHLVLAGGRTPRDTYEILRDRPGDWARWWIWYGDERCLPTGHADRNSTMAGDAFLHHVPIPSAQIKTIAGELGPDAAARDYNRHLLGCGDFDLVLLGLGEDGHTASLFPDRPWGTSPESPDALPVSGAPKPPPGRVSLSAHRLSRSRAVVFLVTGAEKRDAVHAWKSGLAIPAASIRAREQLTVLTARDCL
jgi:6-phosphogluconolactonase